MPRLRILEPEVPSLRELPFAGLISIATRLKMVSWFFRANQEVAKLGTSPKMGSRFHQPQQGTVPSKKDMPTYVKSGSADQAGETELSLGVRP